MADATVTPPVVTFNATGLPLAIPDNDPAGVTSNLPVTKMGASGGFTISYRITHPFVGDLIVTLIAPSGNRLCFVMLGRFERQSFYQQSRGPDARTRKRLTGPGNSSCKTEPARMSERWTVGRSPSRRRGARALIGHLALGRSAGRRQRQPARPGRLRGAG